MPGSNTNVPSYFNWNYTMPSLDANGQLTGSPTPQGENDPSKGVDIRAPDGTWQHMDPHVDRYGNLVNNPTIFMSDSLDGGFAAAYPDTDEYGHIGRVFRTDRNRAIGKMLAIVGGGALAANAMGPLQGAGAAGEHYATGFASASDAAFGSVAPAAAEAGTLAPISVGASYLPGGTLGFAGAGAAGAGGVSSLAGLPVLGTGSMAAFPSLAGGAGGSGTLGNLTEDSLQGATGGGEGASALPGDTGMTIPKQSFMNRLGTMGKNYITNQDGSYNWMNMIKLGAAGSGVLGALTGRNNQPSAPGQPAWMTQPMDILPFNRQQTPNMSKEDYYNYGHSGGEHQFFTNNEIPHKAGGGNVSGPGSGRSDDIEARLSDGEYVMDAETVSLLGDGSTDEGSRRLDQMRENLRKHKGKKLAKGKFSLTAKKPEQYLPAMKKAKGGRVRRFAEGGLAKGSAMKKLNSLADQFQRALSSGDSDSVEKLTAPLTAMHPDSVKTGYEAFAKGGSVADAIRKLLGAVREKPGVQSRTMQMMLTPKDRLPPGTDFNTPVDLDAVNAQLKRMKPDSPAVRMYEGDERRKKSRSTAELYSLADQPLEQ